MNLRHSLTCVLGLLLLCGAAAGQTGNLRGSVVKGQVIDMASDKPVERIRVELRLATGDSVQSTFTRHNGEFEFNNVVNGSYVLVVQEQGYEPVRESVDLGSAQRQSMTLFLRKGLQAREPIGGAISVHELALPERTRTIYRKGLEELYKAKDPADSVAHFRRTLAEAPGFYEALYHLGIALMQSGKPEEAERELRACIAMSDNETYSKPYFALASLLSSRNQFAEAAALARTGIARDGGPWQGHYELARALFELNRIGDAEKSLRDAIVRRPDYAPSYLLLANIHMRNQNRPAIITALDQFLRLEPNGPSSPGARQTRDTIMRQMAREAATTPPPE